MDAIISIDYDDGDPQSYRGILIDIGNHGIWYGGGGIKDDIARALKFALHKGGNLTVSSTVDNFLFDCAEALQDGTVEPLYAIQARLCILHDTYAMSWRRIADRDEYAGISHATLRDIANGANPSPETCKALGFQKTPYRTLAFRFYDDAAFEAARAAVDAGGDRTEWLLSKIEETKDG